MVIDTSAMIAILLAEPETPAFAHAITQDPKRLTSAVSALEAGLVIQSRKGPSGARELDLLMHSMGMVVVSFDTEQVTLARSAYEKFGKGRHPARLNFGDCCTYALSRSTGEPVLFKGDDFSKTDLSSALTAEDMASS